MAVLQVIGKTDTSHNYKDTSVKGHAGRNGDSDVDNWYGASVFDKVDTTLEGE